MYAFRFACRVSLERCEVEVSSGVFKLTFPIGVNPSMVAERTNSSDVEPPGCLGIVLVESNSNGDLKRRSATNTVSVCPFFNLVLVLETVGYPRDMLA